MVVTDPAGIDSAHENAAQSKHDTIEACAFRRSGRPDIKICHHSHTCADGHQSADGLSWDGLLIKDVVEQRSNRCQKHSGCLIEGDGRVCQREVGKNDIQAHGTRKWQYVSQSCSLPFEEFKSCRRYRVQGEESDNEVKSRKRNLGATERRIIEDGFVDENNSCRSDDVDGNPEQKFRWSFCRSGRVSALFVQLFFLVQQSFIFLVMHFNVGIVLKKCGVFDSSRCSCRLVYGSHR